MYKFQSKSKDYFSCSKLLYQQDHNICANMSEEQPNLEKQPVDATKSKHKKIPWILTPIFLVSWVVLFFAVIRPVYLMLPKANTIANEALYPGQFIGERAQQSLYDYDQIGYKLMGSDNNENKTVAFILRELKKIKEQMNQNLYKLDIDLQMANGCLANKNFNKCYHQLQNVVVKLSAKNSKSNNVLLINSHFDSKPMTPGTGDDGAMLVIHLEVMRVLATGNEPLQHPIVFLFNGGEEVGLLGSHAFMSQHKWAKQVKALLNYDCSGSGHRELLFQHTPKNSWLVKYYNEHVRHPYGNVITQEIFQTGLLPSDTDYSVFSKMFNIPGLDFAFVKNGYVYHTKYDTYDVIPVESLQSAGENILALAKALANAPELSTDSSDPMDTGMVFFDFMGTRFTAYPNNVGKILNIVCAICTLIFTVIGLWQISAFENYNTRQVICSFLRTFALQVLGVVLAFGIPVLLAFLLDQVHLTLTWFTNTWLIIGIYMLPAGIGLTLPTMLNIKNDKTIQLSLGAQTQLILYAQFLIMGILLLALSLFNVKSAYLVLLPTVFYLFANIINIVLVHRKSHYYWTIVVCISQLIPCIELFSDFFTLCIALIPMTGRLGAKFNPDLIISVSAALITVLALGFVLPLLNLFKKAKTTLFLMVLVSLVFYGMACFTPYGFPYRPATSVKRIEFQAAKRTFYNFDGTVKYDENGFFFLFDDRRKAQEFPELVDINKMNGVQNDCLNYVACALPLYDFHWQGSKDIISWIRVNNEFILPNLLNLSYNRTTVDEQTATVSYNFIVEGPHQIGFYIRGMPGVNVTTMSLSNYEIEELNGYYQIMYSCGKTCDPANLYIEVQATPELLDKPLIEFAVAAYYIDESYERDPVITDFVNQFPSYTFVLSYPTEYEHHLY